MLKKIASILLIVLLSLSIGAVFWYCYMNIDINKTEKETEAAEYQYVMYDVSLFTALMMNKKRCLMNL